MKRGLSAVAISLLSICSSAYAIPLATVGSADALVDYASLANNGSATEQQFVADYLGVSAASVAYTQLSNSGGSSWLSVDEDPSLYAFAFNGDTPEYFLVKTGSGVGIDGVSGTYDTFLFQNLPSLLYGVIDLDLFTRTHGQVEIDMVSHVGTSGTVSVPEPATLSLFGLGLGLIAVALARRRRPAPA